MIIKLSLFALFSLPLLVMGLEAEADDAKTFPGAMCQTTDSAHRVLRGQTGGLSGAIQNVNGTDIVFICPIVRDTMAANSGEFAAITVGANVVVRCTLEARSHNAETATAVTLPTDNPNPPIVQNTKRFTYAVGNTNFSGPQSGYYYFRCAVPNGGFVVSYHVEEDE
jgi:hypothetical protein